MTSFPSAVPDRALRVALPRPPQEGQPHPFPWLATIAPIVASVGLWALTQSVYALMFAALGPVIAVASVGDARLTARRTRTRERARFVRDCARAEQAIVDAHTQEIGELSRVTPGARALLASVQPDPERWRGSFADAILVRLGDGVIQSSLQLEGAIDADDWALPQLEELRTAAAQISGAPVLVDARLGIGLYGPRPLVLAAARAIVIQLAAQLSPTTAHVDRPAHPDSDDDWAWVDVLPHDGNESAVQKKGPSGTERIVLTGTSDHLSGSSTAGRSSAPALIVAIAMTASELPRQTRVVISVTAAGSEILLHPDHARCGALLSDFVSHREAVMWARSLAESARGEGFAARMGRPPNSVALREILNNKAALQPGLRSAIGFGGTGAVFVDLIDDGPHAIVGGTTGSGKSELLISWVLTMAATRSPSEVSFLFVDFKGGAAFEPLRLLPHGVGVITDLDAHSAHRALSSLSAEVRHRERALASANVRSIDEWGASSSLARLVIVVDEYAAMLDEHPELHTLFVDLAARGRSLGIHLVLCTQRPGGVVRDSILANSGLRLCLRVNNAPDSIGVVGSNAAALLPALPRGRAVLRIHGGPTTLVQIAHTAPTDISAISERWAEHPRARAPWCAPLPTVLHPVDLGELVPAFDLPFALVDYPSEQRQAVGRFSPENHGNLLVVGTGGSGKTTLLDAFEAAQTQLLVTRVSPSLAPLWDAVHTALAEGAPARVLLVDDLDAIVLGCPEDYGIALVDLLTRLLREGPSRGVTTVFTAQRLPGSMHALAALCGSPLLMRMSSRQEHLLAGGDSGQWQPDLPPGGATWRGDRLQVVSTPRTKGDSTRPHSAATVTPAATTPLAVISTRPHDMARRLRERFPGRAVQQLDRSGTDPAILFVSRGGESPVVIGDPDAWLSRWGALAALRETTDLLFDGCSTSEFRALTGSRDIPPPCDRGTRALWLVRMDGSVHRASLRVDVPDGA